MTPRQARAARALLGLDMKTVCALADVGKRTLTEFEAGTRTINGVTESKIKGFYISKGLSFTDPDRDGEGVKFAAHGERNPGAYDKIKNKLEYLDLFDVEDAIEKINSINKLIESLDERLSFSQSIIIRIIDKTGVTQKEIASRIGVAPSFVNSIAVGKKSLPVSHVNDVQKILDVDYLDIERALQKEKMITKLSAKIKLLLQEYFLTWNSIHR